MSCVTNASEKKALGSDELQLQQPQKRVRDKDIPLATPRLQPPSGAWVPVGSGKGKDTTTGYCMRSSVALSSGGSVVAAGITDQGCVRVWQCSPQKQGWTIQRGQDITRLENPSWKNVAMSGDGRVLAIGDPVIREPGCKCMARVRVYRWIPWCQWNGDEFGGRVVMSSDGTVVAGR